MSHSDPSCASLDARADDTDYSDVLIDHEWATRWRIPLTTERWLRRSYEIALVVPGDQPPSSFATIRTVWPTEAEAAVIASAIDYRRDYYFEHWQQKMLRRRLDFDHTTNPYVLMKAEDGWRYRRPTWRDQAWSHTPTPANTDGLVALLDDTLVGHGWHEWKAAHPDIFQTARTFEAPA